MALTDMTDPRDDDDDDNQAPAGPFVHSPFNTNTPPPGGNPPSGPGSPGGPGNPGSTPPPGAPAGPGGTPNPLAGLFGGGGGTDDPTQYLTNYNDKHGRGTPALFRDEVVDQTVSVLISKSKPNPLLVGAPGVGKTHIVEDLARRIVADEVPDQLKGYTVYELPMSSLVSGASLIGQLEERLLEIIDFAKNPDNKAILFIDEIHQLTDTSNPTLEKVAQMLKPELARGDLHVIGATTSQEATSLDDDPAFKRRFSQLIVPELTVPQTAAVLRHVMANYVQHYRGVVEIIDEPGEDSGVIEAIVSYADEFNRAKNHRPDNALTLMDKTMAHAALQHQKMEKQGIPVPPQVTIKAPLVRKVAMQLMTGIIDNAPTDYDKLTQDLSEVLGQEHIIDDVVARVRSMELGVFPQIRPQVWMFAGPSGVGKTRIAEILSQAISQSPPIVINMAEYRDSASVNRIIGSPAGYVGSDSKREKPLDSLESNPRRVVILDEIEKSHRDVQDLFLNGFDKGTIDTASGKVIDFSKAIVVATTNAGDKGKSSFGFGGDTPSSEMTQKQINELINKNKDFRDEFLGRFDYLARFNRLDADVFKQALVENYRREYTRITETRPYFAHFLPEELDQEIIDRLTKEKFDENHGIRPARRTIENWINQTIMDTQQNLNTSSFDRADVGTDAGADDDSGAEVVA